MSCIVRCDVIVLFYYSVLYFLNKQVEQADENKSIVECCHSFIDFDRLF